MCAGILFRKGLVQQPDDDGQVLALIEGGEKHRVLVLDGHCCCCFCEGRGVMDNGWGNNEWQQLELQWSGSRLKV